MIPLQEIENNRNNFLSKQPKYGKDALKKSKGISNYKELSEKISCPKAKASTIINQLLTYKLYEKGKNGKLKRTKELITVGLKQNKTTIEIKEKIIRTRKSRKINTNQIKKEISSYFKENFKKIKHPFNESETINLSKNKLEKSLDMFFTILDSDLKIERLDGLGIRFYESIAGYFGINRMKKSEMIVSFSSLVKNFEPYMKKLAFYKTKNIDYAKLPLGKKLIRSIMEFKENLDNSKENYWTDKSVKKSCIRYTYPFRHIEAHEARDWNVFQMEKIIFYMFSAIILTNIDAYR